MKKTLMIFVENISVKMWGREIFLLNQCQMYSLLLDTCPSSMFSELQSDIVPLALDTCYEELSISCVTICHSVCLLRFRMPSLLGIFISTLKCNLNCKISALICYVGFGMSSHVYDVISALEYHVSFMMSSQLYDVISAL